MNIAVHSCLCFPRGQILNMPEHSISTFMAQLGKGDVGRVGTAITPILKTTAMLSYLLDSNSKVRLRLCCELT